MLPKKLKFPKFKSLFTVESILFSKRIRNLYELLWGSVDLCAKPEHNNAPQ